MSVFESIIYLADYIEENRTFPDCVRLREFFWGTYRADMAEAEKKALLYRTMVMSFDMTLRGLVEEGYTVIISTHNPEHALLFAEKAFVLQDGEVRAAGPSKQVLTEDLMQQIYDLEVRLIDTEFRGDDAKVCLPVKSTR